MAHVIIVGIGGFIGAVLRYWVSGLAQRWSESGFPLGTLLVNVLGCVALGAFMYLVEYRQMFSPELRVFVTIGILGGLTTFSTFGYETFVLLRDSQYIQALGSVAGNVVIGVVAVVLGWLAAKTIGP